jgi:hypothetical protein
MARLVITPSTYVNNCLNGFSFTALTTAAGWYLDASDMNDLVLVAYSTYTATVSVRVSAGTSEMSTSYTGQDFIYKNAGDLSTTVGSSGISVLFIDTARFKSTGGIYIDSTQATGSTALQWAAFYRKPTL